MNKDDGRIYTAEQMEREFMHLTRAERRKEFIKLEPTPRQMERKPPRVGRTEPCPCGSGKKFKRCCWTGRRP